MSAMDTSVSTDRSSGHCAGKSISCAPCLRSVNSNCRIDRVDDQVIEQRCNCGWCEFRVARVEATRRGGVHEVACSTRERVEGLAECVHYGTPTPDGFAYRVASVGRVRACGSGRHLQNDTSDARIRVPPEGVTMGQALCVRDNHFRQRLGWQLRLTPHTLLSTRPRRSTVHASRRRANLHIYGIHG